MHFSCAFVFTTRSLVSLHTAVTKLIGSKLQWKLMGQHNTRPQNTVVPTTGDPPDPNDLALPCLELQVQAVHRLL